MIVETCYAMVTSYVNVTSYVKVTSYLESPSYASDLRGEWPTLFVSFLRSSRPAREVAHSICKYHEVLQTGEGSASLYL